MDSFDLGRFVQAQKRTYALALGEIRRGAKRGHWMWYIYPQMAGLGRSDTSRQYAITSIEEARAFIAHPVLGNRLIECVEALQDLEETSAEEVFGEVDAMKLRSSLTLFSEASGGGIFEAALARWFGTADPQTLKLLDGAGR